MEILYYILGVCIVGLCVCWYLGTRTYEQLEKYENSIKNFYNKFWE